MRRLGIVAFVFLAGAAVASAYGQSATRSDIRELRSEVALLDESLQSLGPNHPQQREFKHREDELGQRITWLREELRRNEEDESQGLGASKTEVESLRNDIRALRRDVDGALGRDGRTFTGAGSIPDGTEIPVVLDQGLSSKTARPEDRVYGTVAASVRVDGRIVIPAGTEVRGVVRQVEPARRPAHGGRLELDFESMTVNGQTVNMDSSVVRVSEHKVDASKTGLGALLGGVVGAVAGGKKGLLIGGVVGAAGAIVATKGDEVEIPAGTQVTLRLQRPMDLAQR
jgi:hypothetical protein